MKAYLSDLVLEKVWRRQWVDSSYLKLLAWSYAVGRILGVTSPILDAIFVPRVLVVGMELDYCQPNMSRPLSNLPANADYSQT